MLNPSGFWGGGGATPGIPIESHGESLCYQLETDENKNKNIKMKTVALLPAWRSSYHFEGPWSQTTAAALRNA